MLSSYDMECLSRWEECWLDPDDVRDEEDDRFEHELMEGDAIWQEQI